MKTIKVIDLLNKIDNGEEVPKKIKIGFNNYHWCNTCGTYEDKYERDLVIKYNILNDEVEIIEEEDINIQDIEELDINDNITTRNLDLKLVNSINKLIKTIKKLDKEINK